MKNRKSAGPSTPEEFAKLNTELLKDIPAYMDRLFGPGQWFFDQRESLYIAADPAHSGEGFGFVAVRPDGSWFKGVRPSIVKLQTK